MEEEGRGQGRRAGAEQASNLHTDAKYGAEDETLLRGSVERRRGLREREDFYLGV